MDRVTAMNYAEYVELQRRREEEGVPGWLEVELGMRGWRFSRSGGIG